MNPNETGYKIEGGYLKGPPGAWELSKISAIYKKEGGRLGLKKFAISAAALAAAQVAIGLSVAHFAAIGVGAFGYLTHRTLRVYSVIEGCEVELLAEMYWEGIWGSERAHQRCDALIELVNKAKQA